MVRNTTNMIFVFGSNLAGVHGAGAARYAAMYRGAVYGVAAGRTGASYAIPTKDKDIKKTLSLQMIKAYVDQFIDYARSHPELQFQVTRIGCGLAGLCDEDIAPMFANASNNCWFDSAWQQIFDTNYFGKKFNYWGTF